MLLRTSCGISDKETSSSRKGHLVDIEQHCNIANRAADQSISPEGQVYSGTEESPSLSHIGYGWVTDRLVVSPDEDCRSVDNGCCASHLMLQVVQFAGRRPLSIHLMSLIDLRCVDLAIYIGRRSEIRSSIHVENQLSF